MSKLLEPLSTNSSDPVGDFNNTEEDTRKNFSISFNKCPHLQDLHFDERMDVEGDEANLSDDFDSEMDDNEIDEEDAASQNMEEIDELLEKPVENEPNSSKYSIKRFKRVLMYRGTDHFDVLPDGWMEVTHSSGLPIYLHGKTRVCTFSRPYFLGPGSVRLHRVPESAIPCYFYQKLREELESRDNTNKTSDELMNCQLTISEAGLSEQHSSNNGDLTAKTLSSTVSGTSVAEMGDERQSKRHEILDKLNAPGIKIKTAKDVMGAQLTPEELHNYAKRRLKFKNIAVYRFRKWQEARAHFKKKRRAGTSILPEDASASTLRPGLPNNFVLITVPSIDNMTRPQQKSFCLNPQGKTSISVLHELLQKILKCTVHYTFSETRNSALPYHCVAKLATNWSTNKFITGSSIKEKLMRLKERYRLLEEKEEKNSEEYFTIGDGFGTSKKHSKLMAAKKAVENLFNGIEFGEDGTAITQKSSLQEAALSEDQMAENKFQIFDNLSVCDSRVTEWSGRAGQPTPYIVLQEYLKRHAAFGDTEINTRIKRLRFKKHRFDMSVGANLHVFVICANKREGKQRAAQLMLKRLLPENTTWGSILRLYGYEAQQKQKEAIKNKESIIKLQDEVRMQNEKNINAIEPNNIILDKLKSEMLKTSGNIIEKKLKASGIIEQKSLAKVRQITNCEPKSLENNNSPKGALDFAMKRARFEAAAGIPSLSVAQIDALEALLHAQKQKLRNKEMSFSEAPILDESQLRELSAKFAQIFPDNNVKVPLLV